MRSRAALWAMVGAAASLALAGCDRPAARRGRTLQSRGDQNEVYLRGVATTLNDLPRQVNLELLPAQPILTAATSDDGKEVRATCTQNPQTADSDVNYLRIVTGNANLFKLDVQPRDIVRYYVNVDQESMERGIEQRTALELRVRRLDAHDPSSALIIEGGLSAPALEPQRIEIWRYSDKRMDAIRSALNRYEKLRQPPSGWEPSPDLAALRQIVEHANLWFRSQPRTGGAWKPPALVDTLPEDLRGAAPLATQLSAEVLRDGAFTDPEGRLLQQAVWCRDIAQWARGRAVTDAAAAAALFDWTVRNVALDRPGDSPTIHYPWQALMYGHGSAAHRAWVFIELCRQQNIDAVVVEPASADGKAAPLLVAAIVDGDLLLFDPALGLPLAADERGVVPLAGLKANPQALRELDLPDAPYPLEAAGLEALTAYVAALPLALSRRAHLLESGLEGENFIRLTANPATTAQRLGAIDAVNAVKLWPVPAEAMRDELQMKLSARRLAAAEFAPFADRPQLWNARVLHFQGNKDLRSEERNDPLAEPRRGHQEALLLYQARNVRPPDTVLADLEPAKREVYAAAKAEATYWLGLLSYDRGNYPVAVEWLDKRTLAEHPQGEWADGARYNLARTHEAAGALDRAIELLEADPPEAPQRHGNRVRAARLRSVAVKRAAENSDAAAGQ